MIIKKEKGSISIFVLVALLFMSGFLIISLANNVGKSKTIKEQFNIISDIYAYTEGDEGAYEKAYADLREKNRQTMTSTSEGTENTESLELIKTFEDKISNYKIYGNSVQDTTNGDPSPTNPVEVESVGDKTVNLFNPDAELEKIGVYLGINTTGIDKNYTLYIKLKEGKTVPEGYFGFVHYGEDTSTGASAEWLLSNGTINARYGDGSTYGIVTFNPSEYYLTGICCYSAIQSKWDVIMDAFDIYWVEGSYTNDTIPEEPYGKYKIPVKVSGNNVEQQIVNIYLDEPLRKVGEYKDYIDFKTGKVVRNISKFVMSNTLIFNTDTEDRILIKNARDTIMKNSNIGMSSIWKYEYPQKSLNTAFLYTGNGYFYWYPDVTIFGVNFKDDNKTIKNPKLQEWLTAQTDEVKTVYYVLGEEDNTETIILPELKSFEDFTKIEVLTEIAPSKIEVEYQGYTLD